MPKQFNSFNVAFRDDHRNYHNRQHDFTLHMYENCKSVGYIDYCEFQGEPSIQFISVEPEKRLHGFATAMVLWLQKKYEGREIQWGMFTDDAAVAFYESLPLIVKPLRSVMHKRTLLQAMRDKRNKLLAECELLRECPFPAKTDGEQLAKLGDALNELHDQIYDHEKDLEGVKDFYTLIDTTGATVLKEEAVAA